MSVCVLGATGAIGVPIAEYFNKFTSVLRLNSKNCDLNNKDGIRDFTSSNCKIFVNASGTFGGLKSYESRDLKLEHTYYNNLSCLIDQLNPEIILNISSASVSNTANHDKESPYYEYVKIKQNVENLISEKKAHTVLHLRCTNIISQYENFMRSGHSISSIYRKYLEAGDSLEIWSHKRDWREYLDADDLTSFLPSLLKMEGHHTLTTGSGKKTCMSEIIQVFNRNFGFNGEVIFTQPHKNGPQSDVVGLPTNLQAEFEKKITPIEISIRNCIDKWREAR